MLEAWKGNAASQANTYFTQLAGAVAAQQGPLDDAAKEIQTVAYGVWGVAKTLDSLLESLLDALIGAGIALAAAAALSWASMTCFQMVADEEPLLDVARGDPARSRFLRASLQRLRESSTNNQFRAMVDDILAGRKSLRTAAASELFNSEVADKVRQGPTSTATFRMRRKRRWPPKGSVSSRGCATNNNSLRSDATMGTATTTLVAV